jgi:hypothetical protein
MTSKSWKGTDPKHETVHYVKCVSYIKLSKLIGREEIVDFNIYRQESTGILSSCLLIWQSPGKLGFHMTKKNAGIFFG